MSKPFQDKRHHCREDEPHRPCSVGVAGLDGQSREASHANRGEAPPLELCEPLDGALPGLLRQDPLRQAAAPGQEEDQVQEAGTGSESVEEGETGPGVWPGPWLEAGRPSPEG